ncbi:hypothetical protein [Nannocystis punicea]|uniref:Uncharacterized protein n=1 Tax=Nannocystis punicea TaxID=2995304 RepID=A0ABY7GX63_9BACT|nr:hypothetical protein [Nannocystis poenicansa]WAS91571.1 hypothetical protein O0S08_35775 [Nannocystis poenicansa]
MVRTTVKPEDVPQVDAAIERLFAAVHRRQPAGIRYWYGRLPDGVTYVALLELDDGVDNPLLGLPEGEQFQEELRRHVAAPPLPEPVTMIGSYRPA